MSFFVKRLGSNMQTTKAAQDGAPKLSTLTTLDSTAQPQFLVSEAAALYRERAIRAGSAVELTAAVDQLLIGPNAKDTMLIMLRQYYPESFSTFS